MITNPSHSTTPPRREVHCEYYEDNKGNFGLRFPDGIEAGELLKLMDEAEKKISRSRK